MNSEKNMLKIHRRSEEELIKECVSNKSEAQKELFDSYSPTMMGVCMRYMKELDLAEELMVMGFTRVFDKIGQFSFSGSFEGWIRRIMVNECLTYLRKNKHMYLEVDIDSVQATPNYKKLNDHLEVEDLMKMIGELPVGYRTVFNLYAIEGYSHKEIAEQLRISENTSKSQLSRARSILQKKLIDSESRLNQKIIES